MGICVIEVKLEVIRKTLPEGYDQCVVAGCAKISNIGNGTCLIGQTGIGQQKSGISELKVDSRDVTYKERLTQIGRGKLRTSWPNYGLTSGARTQRLCQGRIHLIFEPRLNRNCGWIGSCLQRRLHVSKCRIEKLPGLGVFEIE